MTYYVIKRIDTNIFRVASAHGTLSDANSAAAAAPIDGSTKEVFVAAHERDDLYGWLSGDTYFDLTYDENYYSSAPKVEIKKTSGAGSVHMSMTELHRQLDFYPCGLLVVTSTGSVTFSAAKPEEIGHIYSACRMRGLSVSKGLQDAYRKCYPNGIM